MMTFKASLRINEDRLRRHFDALSAYGATKDGGVNRPAFSEAHEAARHWFLQQSRAAGLETRVDGAGNHSSVLRCGAENVPTILMGSHLDSVPYGGRFDGALGVVSALEVLLTVKASGIPLTVDLEAIDFTDEEGRFVGLMGSLALTDRLGEEQLKHPGEDMETFERALSEAGLSLPSILTAGRDTTTLRGYLELHVEQGRRLMEEEISIGIVTSIVGIRSFKICFQGRADHTGTTAMGSRLDACLGASAFALGVRELVMERFPGNVATVGNMVFEPGVFNVVPQSVTVFLEFRADDNTTLDAMEEALLARVSEEADRFRLRTDVEPVERSTPVRMDTGVRESIARACDRLGLSHADLPSGAGHDAQVLAPVCPAGMIFVPSVEGYSHSAREFTEWEDCVNGANVLLHTALMLAQKSGGT